MMTITDKTLWVVSPEVRSIRTTEGLVLLDFERDMYCDLALLSAAVWLLIKWTPAGITVKEIVDLLETAVPLPRRILETETCRLVASLTQNGFVRKRPSRESGSELGDAQEHRVVEWARMNMDKDAVWLVAPDALATYTEDGAVLLDTDKGTCYSLNAVASRIWLAMESRPSGITLEGIVGVLEENFNIPREQLTRDVSDYLDNLQRMSLARCEGQDVSRKIGA